MSSVNRPPKWAKKRSPPEEKKRWYQRWTTRVAGFVAAVALAVASGVATDVVKRALGTSSPASSPTSTSLSPSAGSTTPLLKAGEEIIFNNDEDTWASDRPLDLTSDRRKKLKDDKGAREESGESAYLRDMLDAGAFQTNSMEIDLNLTTDWPKQVRLTSIRAVSACRPPATGTLFDSPGGGMPGVMAKVGFDLDKPVPVAQEVDQTGRFGGDFFADKVQYVSRNDGYAYRVFVQAEKHFCEFHLELDTTDGDRSQTVKVDDHGHPFRISGVVPQPGHAETPQWKAYQRLYVGGLFTMGKPGWTPKDPRSFDGEPERARYPM